MSLTGAAPSQTATSNTATTNAPWAQAQPYLSNIMSDAQMLNTVNGPQQYTPWSQVAGFTPDQLAYQKGTTDYINSPGTQKFLTNGGDAVNGLLQQGTTGGSLGPIADQGAGKLAGYVTNNNLMNPSDATNWMAYGDTINPFLQKNTDAALAQEVNNFNVNTLPGLRREAIGDGSYGSTRNEQSEGMSAGALNKQMNDTATGMYQDAYNTDQANKLTALGIGQGQNQTQMRLIQQLMDNASVNGQNSTSVGLAGMPTALNAPLTLLDSQMNIGGQQFTQDQNQLNDATSRWNFDQNAQLQALQNYAAIVNGQAGLGGTVTGNSVSNTSQPNQNQSVGSNVAGMGLSALGMYLAAQKQPTGSMSGTGTWATPSNLGGVTNTQAISNSITPSFSAKVY